MKLVMIEAVSRGETFRVAVNPQHIILMIEHQCDDDLPIRVQMTHTETFTVTYSTAERLGWGPEK